jgi:hypothetical protein
MKIVNNTDLTYKEIGMLIDGIIKSSIDDTNYYGKVEWTVAEFSTHQIKVQIRYLKRYVEWRFDEVNNA